MLAEQPRGASPRYWEDVAIGDEIDVVTKGPIGLTDEIAFIAGGAAPVPRIAAHRVSLKHYRRHPRWAFRDPSTHALEPVYSVHYNDYAAKLQGAQMAYDVGIQRTCWQIHSLTNWMGDTGFLKALTSQYRAHVYLSDVVRLGGRVVDKAVDEDGDGIVRLETWAIEPARGQRHARHGGRSRCRSAATAAVRPVPPRALTFRRPLPRAPGSAERVISTSLCHRPVARWGDRVDVERIDGVPFRMYVERPRRLEHLLAFAGRWGARPHIVQVERVLTFDDLRRTVMRRRETWCGSASGPANGWSHGLEQRRLRGEFLGRSAQPVPFRFSSTRGGVKRKSVTRSSCCVPFSYWPIDVQRRRFPPVGRARHGKRTRQAPADADVDDVRHGHVIRRERAGGDHLYVRHFRAAEGRGALASRPPRQPADVASHDAEAPASGGRARRLTWRCTPVRCFTLAARKR